MRRVAREGLVGIEQGGDLDVVGLDVIGRRVVVIQKRGVIDVGPVAGQAMEPFAHIHEHQAVPVDVRPLFLFAPGGRLVDQIIGRFVPGLGVGLVARHEGERSVRGGVVRHDQRGVRLDRVEGAPVAGQFIVGQKRGASGGVIEKIAAEAAPPFVHRQIAHVAVRFLRTEDVFDKSVRPGQSRFTPRVMGHAQKPVEPVAGHFGFARIAVLFHPGAAAVGRTVFLEVPGHAALQIVVHLRPDPALRPDLAQRQTLISWRERSLLGRGGGSQGASQKQCATCGVH